MMYLKLLFKRSPFEYTHELQITCKEINLQFTCYHFRMSDLSDNSQLLEILFDGVLQVDMKGRITLWNKAAERITGYPAEKLIGKNVQKQPAKHVSEDGRDLPDGLIPLLTTLKDGLSRQSIAYLKHNEGYQLPVITTNDDQFLMIREIYQVGWRYSMTIEL